MWTDLEQQSLTLMENEAEAPCETISWGFILKLFTGKLP